MILFFYSKVQIIFYYRCNYIVVLTKVGYLTNIISSLFNVSIQARPIVVKLGATNNQFLNCNLMQQCDRVDGQVQLKYKLCKCKIWMQKSVSCGIYEYEINNLIREKTGTSLGRYFSWIRLLQVNLIYQSCRLYVFLLRAILINIDQLRVINSFQINMSDLCNLILID